MGMRLFKGQWAPDNFVNDLRGLAELGEEDFARMSQILRDADSITPLSDAASSSIAGDFPRSGSRAVGRAVSIIRFILSESVKHGMTATDLQEDLQKLDLSEEQQTSLGQRLTQLWDLAARVHREMRTTEEVAASVPVLSTSQTAFGLRAVYAAGEVPRRGDTDPVIGFKPVAMLRLSLDEGNNERAFVFQMDAATLGRFAEAIVDAQSRMEELEKIAKQFSTDRTT